MSQIQINSVKLVYFSPTRTTKRILEAIAQSLVVAVVEHHDVTQPDAKPPLRIESNDVLKQKKSSGLMNMLFSYRIALEFLLKD